MNKAALTTSGSLISAFLASLCCIGPVVFSLIGAGSLGFAAVFEPYRPYLLVTKAEASFASKSAEVEFDPELATVAQLVEAVNKTGFKAQAPKPN